MENIHNKAIFDGLNEALDGLRPYGLKGPPLPWSKHSKLLTFRYGSERSIEDLLSEAKHRVTKWGAVGAGTIIPKKLDESAKKDLEDIREQRL